MNIVMNVFFFSPAKGTAALKVDGGCEDDETDEEDEEEEGEVEESGSEDKNSEEVQSIREDDIGGLSGVGQDNDDQEHCIMVMDGNKQEQSGKEKENHSDDDDDLEDIGASNKQYRPHRSEASMSKANAHSLNARSRNSDSISSYTSTSSTMNPALVRSKVRGNLQKKQKAAVRHRLARKGEASQTTAKRRENRDTVNQSLGSIWS